MSVAKASIYSMRQSARKVRIVLDLIRGKKVEEAYRVLAFVRRQAAESVLKLLRSAVANANQKGEYKPESLFISKAFADQGFSFKKMEPKAMLRHGIQKSRTSHVTIELDVREAAKPKQAQAEGVKK